MIIIVIIIIMKLHILQAYIGIFFAYSVNLHKQEQYHFAFPTILSGIDARVIWKKLKNDVKH